MAEQQQNKYGISCHINDLSDPTSLRLVLRFEDNELYIEGNRTEQKEKRQRHHYFLHYLTVDDLRALKDTAIDILAWIAENSAKAD